jgi:predicted TIM-barrel fold metal-dependent hydrolase
VIIDAYNNAWEPTGTSDYLTGSEHTVQTMLAQMDAAGVDRAVVCSLGQMIDNAFIARLAREHAARLIGFGQVNPRHPDAVAEILGFADDAVLRGLKLHPTMHGYHFADHGLLDPVFAAAREVGLVVLVNALDDPFCGPFAIEEISRNFPDVPVLVAHMGTVWNTVEAMIVAERNPQIYLETSSTSLLEVRTAYERLGPGKIVMGTDWPDSDFELERHKLAKAIPDASDRARVEGANMAALLGLDAAHRDVA